jgi:hypothetical protein
MDHAPHCTDFRPETSLLTRHLVFLVIYLFVGSLLSLSVISLALASDDHDSDDHGGGGGKEPKVDFVIPMNYELGMHCTGFEFAYCCVLPAYNSILAQVIKTQDGNDDFAELLEGDPNLGKDGLGRETVLRDKTLKDGQFQKYVLKYEHEAQPRTEGRGKPQTSTLISNEEGNSLLAWNTVYDSAAINPPAKVCDDGNPDTEGQACLRNSDCNGGRCKANQDHNSDFPVGAVITGDYHGAKNVVLGDGDYNDPTDNYQNGVWNHLYFYEDLEGSNSSNTSLEANKIRLGVQGMVEYPVNCGPALHAMGPEGADCGLGKNNVLTFSEDSGTVVFTQMKVLENLPVMLTSPRIWEALGLPLTPFEDTIGFFDDPGLVDEDSIRPYVKMKATMHRYDGDAADGAGAVVIDSHGNPVEAFGTAPIDIPNCERCHSAPAEDADGNTNVNSPNVDSVQAALVDQETAFWKAYYPSMQTGSDWYARLKGAAISMLSVHDDEHGTMFTKTYTVPGFGTTPAYPGATCTNGLDDCEDGPLTINPDNPGAVKPLPQNTRLGNESVICQKCHADNVIAVVKSANCGETSLSCDDGDLIPALTEAIHYNHRNVSEGGNIVFNDAEGRDGGCQGCHPAHRSDGDMDGYPITLDGDNFYANADNRDANGGCFVGRDVHSNPGKDDDGAETPSHLNPVGDWLLANVANDSGNWKGIWCTNCHSQAGQELWKAENVEDLIHAQQGDPGHVREPNDDTLAGVVNAVNFEQGTNYSVALFESWLDPKNDPNDPTAYDPNDKTHAIWAPDPGLCDYVSGYLGITDIDPAHDGNVATVRVSLSGACGGPAVSCGGGVPDFWICGSSDLDGDFSVEILDFCTTKDCVADAQSGLGAGSLAVPVPMSAATDGRDHWLSPGEPHCADCHEAPYVEQSGNISNYPPFNYPRKASLMRYTRGHRDITCQGCHESIHGLYPVTANIDTTSYAQAAQWNADDSHGPLKCQTCHRVNSSGVHERVDDLVYDGGKVEKNFDRAVGWMHTFTDEHDPTQDWCQNCHEDEVDEVCGNFRKGGDDTYEEEWLEHATKGRASRKLMDQVENDLCGNVAGEQRDNENPLNTVCQGCHGDERKEVSCGEKDWKEHLTKGRVAESLWVSVSNDLAGSTCGW